MSTYQRGATTSLQDVALEPKELEEDVSYLRYRAYFIFGVADTHELKRVLQRLRLGLDLRYRSSWSLLVSLKLEEVEELIRSQPVEWVATFDRDGGLQRFVTDGKPRHCAIPQNALGTYEHYLVTHNHPHGRTLSLLDFKAFSEGYARIFRAVVPSGEVYEFYSDHQMGSQEVTYTTHLVAADGGWLGQRVEPEFWHQVFRYYNRHYAPNGKYASFRIVN